jgi:hypothetical protein
MPPVDPTTHPALPVAVIGAGPIGLAAAAHLVSRGETPLVLEVGSRVGASILEWGHVRLFSPWKYLVDEASRRLLASHGWTAPDGERLPTGHELVERYLEPLAALPEIAPSLRLGHRAVAVSRLGFDKVKSAGREEAPFEVLVETRDGRRERLLARAVIDASGTWRQPNPLGANGLPVPGEEELAERLAYRVPDVLGSERRRYTGKRTIVVGSGHSAFNALLDLAQLAEQEPGTEVTWAIRRPEVGLMFGGGGRDALTARGALGDTLRRRVESGAIALVRGFRTTAVRHGDLGLLVEGEDGARLGPFDELVVATGFRPDLLLARELRLSLDAWLESPTQLAPLIDPNVHSCGTVYPHGAAELAHPEKDFYVVGMKSYGRAPTFLLLTGYEQVRSVVCKLVGDDQGAREVRLVLPETGVCSTGLAGSPCCGSGDAVHPAIAGSCGVASACASPAAATATSSGGGCCG